MDKILLKLKQKQEAEIKVKDLMTPQVYVLYENDNLDVARLLMDSIHIRHIPVVRKNSHFVGLITHRDLLKMSVSSLADFDEEDQQKIHQKIPLKQVMNTEVETVGPEEKLKTAIQKIISNKFGCLPVVEDNRLVGILTEADFVKFTYKLLCSWENQEEK